MEWLAPAFLGFVAGTMFGFFAAYLFVIGSF